MRNDPSPLSTYLNAGMIGLGILLGIWAKHEQAASPPAAIPANSTAPSVDRWDQAGALSASASSPLST